MSSVSRVYENRRSAASIGAVTLFAGGLLGFALLYDGEATADVELNDSGVWVTQTSSGQLGRFNYDAKALDGVLLASSASFDVEQDAQRVLLDSSSDSSASPVNPAQLVLDGSMELPPGAQVASGGATTAVYDEDEGRLWVLPFDGAVGFDQEELKPTLKVGKGGKLAVGKEGTVFLAVPADAKLYTVPTGGQGAPRESKESNLPLGPDAKVEVSAVGDEPVVLDQSSGNLVLPGGETVKVEDGAEGRLQQPSAKTDNVVLATPNGLVTQPLGGGDATTRAAQGAPSAPVQLEGCTYGAWETGQVIRDCAGTDNDVDQVLEGVAVGTSLVYRVNRDVIVLNDIAGGTLWMASDLFEKVNDWDIVVPEDGEGKKTESEEATPQLVDNFVADRNKANRPPKAKEDSFGVRPGRTTVLNVLGNDADPDGDVMTVSVMGEPDGAVGVDRVLDGAALQANVPADASGTTNFKYEVDDGRGGKANSSVAVKVVPLEENNPPQQMGEPVLTVGQEGTASIKVLPYFKDPDGDDLFLSSAATADPLDEVRARPDGTIEFRDGGATTGRKVVDITVSDSGNLPFQGKLLIQVVASNVAPVPVQDHVKVLVGEPVTVEPLRNDYDPNGDKLRLTSVAETKGATITPNYAAGVFRFVSDKPGSYDVTYQITDGPKPTMGLVRVDVENPPDDDRRPVAVTDQVLLPTGGTALVDVLANDTDPAGGVLVVQGVDVPDNAPVKVAVLNHQILKISEIKRLNAPVTFNYTVANGTGTTTGQVRVVSIPAPEQLRPPEAGPDDAIVHAGDVVTIPVLKNDAHPDGLELELTDELKEAPPASAGEAFVSEDTVRFKAGKEAGTFHAVYEVSDVNGQKDSAQVTITVLDKPENASPQLPDITARVLSGGTTRIPLKLDGSDPDGDYVTLSAISAAASKGTARIVDGFIDYTAGGETTGLDTFSYEVTDTRGAVGKGLVRVGIVPKPASNQPPQAADDETMVRPDRTVAIRALENDTDPDGDEIGLVSKGFEGTGDLKPKVVEDDVVVTAPGKEGSHSFYYGIQDSFKAPAGGAITVNVKSDAPLLRPIAYDDVVTSDDVEGDSSVTIDVLANDVDPDGVAAELDVAVDPPLEGVRVTEKGLLEVQLTSSTQVITYTVTDMDGLKAKAFVRVPGDQERPHLKPGLEPLKATSGEPLTIELEDYVVVREDHKVRITEGESVKGIEGKAEAPDKDTIVYTSAADYAGAASVSFEVTDGVDAEDPKGLSAVLTLPIDVTPSTNMPPKITGTPVLEVAEGEESSVDLSRYVKDPDKDTLTFQVKGSNGITPTVSGSAVSAMVDPSVSKGTFQQLPLTVSDNKNPAVSGELTVKVVGSTRDLVQTTDDVVIDAHQGEATTIPVLANDTNPFPEKELTLVGSATVETGSGKASYSGNQLVVTPGEDFTGAMVVRYTVQDATEDPDREVDGIAKLTVLGKPEAPRAPRVEEVRSETVVLSWEQPNNNGADITSYMLRTDSGQEHECATTTCTFDGLKNNVKYRFTVTATNEVGESEPSPASREARPDEKPDQPSPPTLVFGDKFLTVSWKNQTYTDRSPIECVNLEISPAPTDGVTQKTCQQGNQLVWRGLENGVAYTVRVQAKNDAPDPSDWSEPSAPETPAGKPETPAAPTAQRTNDLGGGRIDVTWTAPANNGDAIRKYYLAVYEGGSKVRTIPTADTSANVSDLNPEASYTFTVEAENKAGRSPVSPQSNSQVPYGQPTVPSNVQASNPADHRATVSWSAIPADQFRGPAHRYEVSANGSGSPSAGNTTSYVYGNLNNGTSYTFQVRACNESMCSDWSSPSNAVVPYGPVPRPTISAQGGSQQVTFNWDGTGENGRPTTVSVTNAVTSSAKTGRQTVNTGYSQTLTACIQVTDSEGQKSENVCASGTSDPKPNPTATVTNGSRVNNGDCNTRSCAYFYINFANFEPGNHQVACWAEDTPEVKGWHDIVNHARDWGGSYKRTYNFGDGSGGLQLNCFFGHPGTPVRVLIDGQAYGVTNWWNG
ncbi:Ig-like domain-containing protein [Promicromonospora sp. NPDC050249]|uniref:Ig-like domain-containing protein n=1 Tax=Promicromonospora sp. NPDC050249 TaxID=3154743 RepID=UPI0033C782F6